MNSNDMFKISNNNLILSDGFLNPYKKIQNF